MLQLSVLQVSVLQLIVLQLSVLQLSVLQLSVLQLTQEGAEMNVGWMVERRQPEHMTLFWHCLSLGAPCLAVHALGGKNLTVL